MSARDIVFALGRNHVIDVLDPSPVCQLRFSSLVRRWYRCPSYSRDPQAYLNFLLERLQTEKYDVLLPTHEQTYLLSRFREVIRQYVGLAVPDFETLEQMQSKATFARLLDRLEIPSPPTKIVVTRQELEQHTDFPCFVKVDFSTAGRGVWHVHDQDEMRAAAAAIDFANGREVLIQQPARGLQCSALAVFDAGRMLMCLPCHIRKPGVGGWGMNGESVDHPEVVEQVRQMGEYLQFHGALFVDYFYDPQTRIAQYIEANPRLGAALFPELCGQDVANLFLDLSLNRPVQPLPAPRVGVRYHQGFLMLISAAKSGATRGQLFRELLDAIRRRGFYANSTDTITQPTTDWLSVIPATAVTLLLLAWPRASHWLVRRTLENYALSEQGVQAIRDLSPETFQPPGGVELLQPTAGRSG